MSTSLNSAGVTHAHALVKAGKVNNGKWSFSGEDGNALLGPNGDDWANFGKWFLATHPDQPEKTKDHYGYPFGKDGEIYRNAVSSAKGRAAQQGATAVEDACSSLLDEMDKGKGHMTTPTARFRAPPSGETRWAHSVLSFKSFTDDPTDGRTYFEGIATTPTPDLMEDEVMPEGAMFKLPIPFLYQHDSRKPIGNITEADVTSKGIKVKGYVESLAGPPSLKERLDVARAEMKAGLVRGLSIGFKDIEYEPIKGTYGYRFLKWLWLELSAVTIAANQEASLTTIKAADRAQLRSLSAGARCDAEPQLPAVAAKSVVNLKGSKMKQSIQEQLAGFEAKRAASVAAMERIMDSASEEATTLTQEQSDEYERLAQEVTTIDEHLKRLKKHEAMTVSRATAVVDPNDKGGAGSSVALSDGKQVDKGGIKPITWGKSNLPKGIGFARLAIALAFSKGNIDSAAKMAERWKDSTPEVANVLRFASSVGGTDFAAQIARGGEEVLRMKAAVAAGTTTDATWASPLVQYDNLASEFVALLYPATIIGRMTGLRRVPFNIRFPSQSAGATVGWVGQGIAKPVSKLAFATNTLGFSKAAGIVVITQELARFSSPAAEGLVRDDLVNTMSQFEDQQFINPAIAAVANVSPAAITNGITAIQSTGATRALIDADVASLMAPFLSNNIPLTNLQWIMTPYNALKLSMLRETTGEFSYPDITLNGGTWQGIPVITSNNVPSSVSAGSIIVLVAAGEIFMADEGGVQLDSSQEASVQMDSAPTNAGTPTATSLVSLWQDNMIGIRVEHVINWQRRRDAAVGYIDNVHL